jgi:hypothetical protein
VTPNPDVVTVPANGTANASLTIAASTAGAGNQTIPLEVSAAVGSKAYAEAQTGLPVNVAYPSLAAAFNNTGISDNSDPASASFDTGGDSFSEEELTSAGFGPGATFTHDGVPYTWPAAAAGSPDNVIGYGQAIAISGSGSTLGLLGASNNGNATGPVTVVYTDGTSTSTQVTLDDWYSNAAAPGGDILVTTPDWNQASSTGPHAVSVYAASVPIDPSKTVADVILPTQSAQPSSGPGPFHVFAIGIGS